MPTSIVKVVHHDGTPASGRRVVLGFPFGNTSSFLTDRDGEAKVEHESSGRATVFVDGRNCTSFHAPGSISVTI
jgi:hypothetical protein